MKPTKNAREKKNHAIPSLFPFVFFKTSSRRHRYALHQALSTGVVWGAFLFCL